MKSKDGFGYDLDKALKEGNIFEKIFHQSRVSFWLNTISYKEKKVLDVGCNTGILLIPLLERGVDIFGVDISKEDILVTRKKLKEKGFSVNRALVADSKMLPFEKNKFDVVLLSDILEHVEKPEQVAREALRVTKVGGFVLTTVPNELHPVVKFTWLRKALSGRRNVDEYSDTPFSRKKLVNLFPRTKVIESKLIGFGAEIFCRFKKP